MLVCVFVFSVFVFVVVVVFIMLVFVFGVNKTPRDLNHSIYTTHATSTQTKLYPTLAFKLNYTCNFNSSTMPEAAIAATVTRYRVKLA